MKTKVARGTYVKKGKESKMRSKKGCGSYGKYKSLPLRDFAGKKIDGNCNYTYPINTLNRARNALARSHYARNPRAIRMRVFKRYPQLLKNSRFDRNGYVRR